MIELTNLMKGDYVYVPCNGKVCRVEEIGGIVCVAANDGEEVLFCNAEDIDPIPLTQDMLENIGTEHSVYEHPYFEYEPTEEELNERYRNYPFHCYELGKNVTVTFYPDNVSVHVFGQDFVNEFKIRNRKGIVCVHELQHALKLCGIEKEIVL